MISGQFVLGTLLMTAGALTAGSVVYYRHAWVAVAGVLLAVLGGYIVGLARKKKK